MSIIDTALANGHFTQGTTYYYNSGDIKNQSELAYLLWNNETVLLDGESVNIIETLDVNNDYSDDNHGDPIKIVFEALGKTWIAEGRYDSWGGDHFEADCILEAELVDKPVWVAKPKQD